MALSVLADVEEAALRASGAEAAPMIPVDFDGQAGWWHPAGGDVVVILCPPVGRDARCAYRPLRLFADRLAAAGYPTLRFDYPGEGESCDVDPAADALPLWREGVRNAMRFVRRLGARKVVLGGLRAGGALAAELAGDLGADGLMLLAPVASGRGWLRELKLRAAMATLAFRDPEPGAFVSDDLRFSQPTVDALSAWTLKSVAPPRAPVFLAAQSPPVAAVGDRLREAGADVEAHGFPGYDLLFEEPHSNLAPQATFDQALAWLRSRLPSPPRHAVAVSPRRMSGDGWLEEGAAFGPGLRGVICRPTTAPMRPEAVVFLSTGGDPRPGLGRFPVTAGRRLAAAGVASLRFDFAGLGDSDAPEGTERTHVFADSRIADIAAAADLLQAKGCATVALVGVCSGAFHAVRAAPADARISGLFAVSTLNFVWRAGMTLSVVGRETDASATRSYVEGLRDPKNWLRVLKGDVQVMRILRALSTRAIRRLRPGEAGRDAAAVGEGLKAYAARGGRARFLLGVHDAALDEMERWFGRGGRRLAAMPNTSVRVIPGMDHGLSYPRSRAYVLEELLRFVGADA